jgi:ribonuclease T2
MKTSLKLVILAAALLLVLQAHSHWQEAQGAVQPVGATPTYLYYFFEREWPGTVCLTRSCTKAGLVNYDGLNFNMHGLWPNGKSGSPCFHPEECQNLKYNQGLLQANLLAWMNSNYVGLYSDSTSFRAHEFEKHGTCWTPTP